MQITATNIGDVIRMDHHNRHIQIEAVTDEFVQYRQETGERYATFEHEIEGSVVRDGSRIQEFQRNANLGAALKSAELRAIRSLLDGTSTREQLQDANSVLESVRAMSKHLAERISQHERNDAGRQTRSLAAIISRASAESQAQQQSGVTPISHSFNR